jgi:hypothetical protein
MNFLAQPILGVEGANENPLNLLCRSTRSPLIAPAKRTGAWGFVFKARC